MKFHVQVKSKNEQCMDKRAGCIRAGGEGQNEGVKNFRRRVSFQILSILTTD